MKPIPIYDATVPIVCTAGAAEVPRRIDEIERLRTNVIRVEHGERGMLLHFPNRPELAEDVRRFTLDEKQCCQFWGFDIAAVGDELILRWDAPPTAQDLLERLTAYFAGDEPLSAISGLL